MQVYETKRLIVREINEDFASEILQYFQRNRVFLEEWEAKRSEEFYSLDTQMKLLQQDVVASKNGQSCKLWIMKKDDPHKIIGCISFSLITRGILQSSILGYKLDQNEIGKGYITEALRKAIEVAFKELKLHRIEAPIMPRNLASIEVVKKLGFENEGTSRKMIKVNGVWEDHIRWALINEND